MNIEYDLQREFFGNTLNSYLIALAVFTAIYLGLILFRTVVGGRLKALAAKTEGDFDDFLADQIYSVGQPVFFALSLYLSTRNLQISVLVSKGVHLLLLGVITYRALRIAHAAVGYGMTKSYLKDQRDPATEASCRTIISVINAVLWCGAGLFVLANLGVNISAVLAGMGIGGVAIALASQAILGDLFSSFVIFMDKPFQVGDFIIVGDLKGVVEHIGIKTTRLRSLSGEQLVMSNSDLTNSRIRNFKRMESRRIIFEFGVIYQTPLDKVARIPDMIRQIIEKIPNTRVDRIHFKSFGASSLDFEAVYYVLSAEYIIYADIQQKINLELAAKFQQEKIEFAYPTQTLYMAKD